jgi:hypothetical protein
MSTPISLPTCAQNLLDRIYPTVDWSRVIFLSGLPYWASSATVAITLPDPIDPWRFRVYLGAQTDFCDPDTLASLVHEGHHVAQFMSIANGYGFGFFRPAFIAYFACWMAHGYDDNPFEVAAYDYEKRFAACYKKNRVCDCSSGAPVFNPDALKGLVACDETLVVREIRAPLCRGLWWLLAFPFVFLLAIIAFLGHLFDGVHCVLIKQQFDKCLKQGLISWQECALWGQTTFQQCTQWADQGYNQCNEWADEGYNQCSEWADWGYDACCDWAPCSWFCKVLVWISNWVCVATVWITNLVCKVSIWISVWVCLVTVWVTVLICLLWKTITQLVCLIWTTITYFVLFCWLF